MSNVKNPDLFAALHGLIIVEPEPRQLQLDIDVKLSDSYYHVLHVIGELNPILSGYRTTSKSGNTHEYITLSRDITPIERLLMQACLGSDPMREILTYKNILDGNPRPQFLFERKPLQLGEGK